ATLARLATAERTENTDPVERPARARWPGAGRWLVDRCALARRAARVAGACGGSAGVRALCRCTDAGAVRVECHALQTRERRGARGARRDHRAAVRVAVGVAGEVVRTAACRRRRRAHRAVANVAGVALCRRRYRPAV